MLARLAEREMKWAEAQALMALAVELAPWHGGLHSYYGGLLQQTFQSEEGLKHVRRAAQLEPLNPFFRFVLGNVEAAVGHYERASEQLYLVTELSDSKFVVPIPLFLARSLYLSGRKVEAASSMLDWAMGIPGLRAAMLAQPDIKAGLEVGDMTSMIKFLLASESICSNDIYFVVWYSEFNDHDGVFRCTTAYLAADNVASIASIASIASLASLSDISLRPYLHDERMKPLLEATGLFDYLPEESVSEGVK